MSTHDRSMTGDRGKTFRTAVMAVGVVFLLVGVLGFIPGITTDYGELQFAGHTARRSFSASSRCRSCTTSSTCCSARPGSRWPGATASAITYSIGGGAIYLVLWVYGLLVGPESSANFVPLNTADNWLHLVLGLGMIGLGVAGRAALKDNATAHAA